jgi:hypothetical protein
VRRKGEGKVDSAVGVEKDQQWVVQGQAGHWKYWYRYLQWGGPCVPLHVKEATILIVLLIVWMILKVVLKP